MRGHALAAVNKEIDRRAYRFKRVAVAIQKQSVNVVFGFLRTLFEQVGIYA